MTMFCERNAQAQCTQSKPPLSLRGRRGPRRFGSQSVFARAAEARADGPQPGEGEAGQAGVAAGLLELDSEEVSQKTQDLG